VAGSFSYSYYASDGSTALSGAPTNAGNYYVTAAFTSSDSNYGAATSTQTSFTIGKATPTVQVSDPSALYNQAAFTATATVAGVVPGVDNTPAASLENVTPTLTYYNGSTASGTALSGAPLLPGTYTVQVSFAGSLDYTPGSATATFMIKTTTTSITGPNSGLPGQSLTYTFAVSGPTQDISFNINFGDGTNLKTSAAGPTIKLDHVYAAAGNYIIHVTGTDNKNVVSQVVTHPVTIGLLTNPTAFVEHLYFDLLGRQADSNGLNAWVKAINNGTLTKSQVVAGFEASTEFRTDEIKQTYVKFLRRSSDSSGLATWTNFLGLNHSLEQLQANVIASGEFIARFGALDNTTWLTAVYADVLNRAPDSAGLTGWLADLANGFGSAADHGEDGRFDLGLSGNSDLAFVRRAEVVDLILRSPEAERDLVEGLYRALLRRPSDPTGLNTFVKSLLQGQPNVTANGGSLTEARDSRFSDEQVIIGIAGSDEYFARAAATVDPSGGLFNSPFGMFAASGGLGPTPGSPFLV
jgi:hypothetical protein